MLAYPGQPCWRLANSTAARNSISSGTLIQVRFFARRLIRLKPSRRALDRRFENIALEQAGPDLVPLIEQAGFTLDRPLALGPVILYLLRRQHVASAAGWTWH